MDTNENNGDIPLYRYRAGRIEFDEARFELRVDGELVKLERKPLLVLGELLRHANEVVSRRQLLDAVWGGRPMVEQGLANALVKLRKAVKDPPRGDVIATVRRGGYKFVGAVERTAVGRRLRTQLELKAGEAVPGRRDALLESQLQTDSGGEIWLARLARTGERRVFKFGRDAECVAALKREAQILEALRKSLGTRGDLVQLLSSNFQEPPFYIECEHGGVDLGAWAAADERLGVLPIEQRVRLFLQIAVAVQAVHSVGVLHQDLKPANILIAAGENDGWRVRLADFGSARVLESGLFDEAMTGSDSSWAGQPASDSGSAPLYIAPEVIDGQPTTLRSDVYALGLLLYQIVTANLRRPLAPGWESEIDDTLLREDIAAATAGDPDARLSSVGELIDRLQKREARERQRLDAAASVQRAALAERELQRTRARRPWLVAALVSLVVGMGTSIWLYRGESAARREAERQGARLQEVNDFLNRLLRAADPNIPGGNAKATLEDALARARSELDGQFAGQFSGDPVTKGALYASLGEAYFGLSKYDVALEMQRRAEQLLSEGFGPRHEATLTVQYQTARTLDMLTRHAEAQQLLERTDRAAGPLLQRDSRLALLAHWAAGGNALMQTRPELALARFKAADAVRQRVLPRDDAWLIRVRASMAWCDVRMERHDHAIEILGDLMAPEYTPERIGVGDWAKVHFQYALALMTLRRYQEAERVTTQAIEAIARMVGSEHYLVGLGWNHLAAVLKAHAQWDRALEAARNAHRIFHGALGEYNRATLNARADLAVLEYLGGGRAADAVLGLASIHSALEDAVGPRDAIVQGVDYYWANALLDVGDARAAAGLFESLDAATLSAIDPGIDWDLRLQGLKGRILLATGRKDDGRVLLQAAVAKMSDHKVEPWVIAAFRRDLER